jgi:hypothetical protein
LARREIKQRPPTLETTKKSLETVSDLGDQLKKVSLTRSDALKDLAKVSDKLKEQLGDLAKDPGLKKMEQAARSPSGNPSETAAGMQKQMEALQKQLGGATPEAMDFRHWRAKRLKRACNCRNWTRLSPLWRPIRLIGS